MTPPAGLAPAMDVGSVESHCWSPQTYGGPAGGRTAFAVAVPLFLIVHDTATLLPGCTDEGTV